MTVATTTNTAIGTGNGATTVFPFTFGTLPTGDLVVTLIDLDGNEEIQTEITDYTVSGEGAEDGGSVTFLVAPPDQYTVLIQRILPFTQPTDYKNQGSFYPRTHERSFDRVTMQVQQLAEADGRTIKIPAHVQGVSTTLPTPVGNGLWGWNEDGTEARYFTAAEIGTTLAFSNFRADTFTATAGQTDFVLTDDPGVIANLDVSIDGVTQVPTTDYTLDANVLTFTTPLAGGETVLARYGTALPLGFTDANLVTYEHPGTLAETTVEEFLDDEYERSRSAGVHAFDFIPKAMWANILAGTSTDDVTAYLQAAVAYLGSVNGGTLMLGRGLFNISATLDIPYNNVHIVGEGAGYYSADGIAAVRASAATRISWVGAAPATGTAVVEFRTPSTARSRGRGSIRDVMIDGNVLAKVGLAFTSYSHGRADNVHVYACMEDGFLCRTVNYALLAGAGACQFNTFYSCAVTAYGGSGAYLTNPCSGFRFVGSRYWHIIPGQNGDSSHNTVYSPRFDLAKGTAITFESVGQNVIHSPQGGAWAGTTSGYDIIFGSTDQDSTYPPSAGVTHPNAGVARYNAVFYCEHAVVAKASINTNGAGSFGNMVWGASRGNVAPEPWIEAPVNNTKRPELTFHTMGTSPNGTDPSRTYLGGILDVAGRDDTAGIGPVLSLIKNSDAGTAGDGLARIQWRMTNAAGTINVGAGHWDGSITNAAAGSETVQLSFFPMFGGVETQKGFGLQNGAILPDANLPNLTYQGFGTVNVSVGYYVDNVKVVGPRDTGWTAMTGTANKATAYSTATVTLVQLAERVKALQDALATHGLTGT